MDDAVLDRRRRARDKPPVVLPVHGFCDLRFGAVLDAFRDGFVRRDEVGAAVAAMVDGKLVVDLWAGHADAARERPWSRNTLTQIDAVTEMLAALCVLMLADAGIVELDVPVARYWPEFGDHGKVPITIRHVLTHRAGLPDLRSPLMPEELIDWDGVIRRLAAEPPWSAAGAEVACHARTAGFLLGEVVRRVSGRTVGTFFHDEIGRPLGLDVHLGGLGPDQDHRIADVIGTDHAPSNYAARAWRQAEVPTANAHATARGLARLMATLARGGELDGVRVLGARMLEPAREHASAVDPPHRRGLGVALAAASYPFAGAARAFGAADGGGATAFADPDADAGFAYTPNRRRGTAAGDGPDPRAVALVDALYESL